MAKLFLTISDVIAPAFGFCGIRGAHVLLFLFYVVIDCLLMPISILTDFLKEPQHLKTLTPRVRPMSIGYPILVNRPTVIDFLSHFYFFYKNFFSNALNTHPFFFSSVPPLQNSGTGSGTAESLLRQALQGKRTAVPPVPPF
tara:strand:- start:2 stop:427 length:426 start_codon:yes stop_codon:yes gene_type:complete